MVFIYIIIGHYIYYIIIYFIKIYYYYVMCVEGVVSSADLLSGMKRKQSFLVQSTKEKVAAFPRGS